MIRKESHLLPARFLSRPNRFIAEAELGGQKVICHMPNPGRMWELLYPGASLYLRRAAQPGRKTLYDVAGIERDGVPILLDTQYTNDTAAWLIETGQVPGWEDWHLVRREVKVGGSRFDLLLGRGNERFYVEVKSCTLFGRTGAMFPDAVTERGRRHVMELAEMHRRGIRTGLLFLVHWDRARWFLPDYHTDPAFAAAFREAAEILDWKALALRWDASFTVPKPAGLLTYRPEVLDRENHDSGDYFIVLRLSEAAEISVGSLGRIHFPAGYYVYVGSARKNLDCTGISTICARPPKSRPSSRSGHRMIWKKRWLWPSAALPAGRSTVSAPRTNLPDPIFSGFPGCPSGSEISCGS